LLACLQVSVLSLCDNYGERFGLAVKETKMNKHRLGEISGSHGSEYEDESLLE
jgi:hypothetical protein